MAKSEISSPRTYVDDGLDFMHALEQTPPHHSYRESVVRKRNKNMIKVANINDYTSGVIEAIHNKQQDQQKREQEVMDKIRDRRLNLGGTLRTVFEAISIRR